MGDTLVVLPDNTELQDTLRDLDYLQSFLVLGVGVQEWLQAGGEFVQSLVNNE